MSAACLSNSILLLVLLLLLGLVSLIPFYFLLSWLLMHFFLSLSLDVSVGVVVVCNLRRFFFLHSFVCYITQTVSAQKGRRPKLKNTTKLKRMCVFCVERNTPTHAAHTCACQVLAGNRVGKRHQLIFRAQPSQRRRRRKKEFDIDLMPFFS